VKVVHENGSTIGHLWHKYGQKVISLPPSVLCRQGEPSQLQEQHSDEGSVRRSYY